MPPETPVHDDIRQGFVYERVPHITLKSIANNPLIDDIWEKWQAVLAPLREVLNGALGTDWQEWQIPRELTAEQSALSVETGPIPDLPFSTAELLHSLDATVPERLRPRSPPATIDGLHSAWWRAPHRPSARD